MTGLRSLIVALVLGMLSGCSLFAPKPAEPRQSSSQRQLLVTLIGGSRLNVTTSGEPRPVQSCVYIVNAIDWVPMASGDASCAGRDQDGTVLSVSRHVIAPNQVLQFWIDVSPSGKIWLVADADYARRPAQYAPLRMPVDGSGVIQVALWLDRDGIYDASLPGPVPVVPGSRTSGAHHAGIPGAPLPAPVPVAPGSPPPGIRHAGIPGASLLGPVPVTPGSPPPGARPPGIYDASLPRPAPVAPGSPPSMTRHAGMPEASPPRQARVTPGSRPPSARHPRIYEALLPGRVPVVPDGPPPSAPHAAGHAGKPVRHPESDARSVSQ
nr:type VI secretion lipoprotein TssJ [Burkholderia guangdongensis]